MAMAPEAEVIAKSVIERLKTDEECKLRPTSLGLLLTQVNPQWMRKPSYPSITFSRTPF